MILSIIYNIKVATKQKMESDNIFRDSFFIGVGVTAGNKVAHFMEAFIYELCTSVKLPPPPPHPKISKINVRQP